MRYIKFLLPLILFILLALPIWAQSDSPYELIWLAFDSSGTANGGQYEVVAQLGQLDNQPLSGGDYTVEGRFGIGGETIATTTAMPTPTATSTPVAGEVATPTPSPTNRQNQLYLPIVSKK